MEAAAIWMTLQGLSGIGYLRLKSVVKSFPDALQLRRVRVDQLAELEGWNRPLARRVVAALGDETLLDRARRQLAGYDAQPLLLGSAAYPRRLDTIDDPPPLLFRRGRLAPGPRVAVVGARRPTGYGLTMAHRLGRDLARAGVTVVSGMALGIDSMAHRGALEVGGSTVAVLAGGVDVVYPPGQTALYRRLLNEGAVLSEQLPGAAPLKHRFVGRNRIISGMSDAVVIVEGTRFSGARHTAEFATQQHRLLCAVPGPATSRLSDLPNSLIAGTAILVTCADDVLRALGEDQRGEIPATEPPAVSAAEAVLLEHLHLSPLAADQLAARTGLQPAQLLGALTLLELKGQVRRLTDHRYECVG